MSDSEPNTPSEAAVSRKLRDIVGAIYKAGNHDDLTLKRVRARAEEELGLSSGFLKNAEWNQKSKATIVEAVDNCRLDEPAPSPKSTPAKKAATKSKAQPKPKPTEKNSAKSKTGNTKGVKRKAAAPAKKPQKRQKTATSDEDSEPELSDAERNSPKKLVRRVKNVVAEDSEEEDDDRTPKKATRKDKVIKHDESEGEAAPVKEPGTPPPETINDKSDSEMSILLDDSPPKNKRQKKEPAAKTKKEAKPTKATANATKSKGEVDPDAAEIKRLQGWLVKCGIRKVWSKELASCDTSKEKIRHLKAMLKDAGMDGKYSVEKAAKIKEKREFAKDLAAIQEGEAAWGKTGEETGGRPRRRAAAAAANRTVQKIVLEGDDEEDEEDGDRGEDDESSDDGDDDDDDDGDDDVQGESQDDDDQSESDAGDDSE